MTLKMPLIRPIKMGIPHQERVAKRIFAVYFPSYYLLISTFSVDIFSNCILC